jgi:dihydropteroate synthase
MGFGIDLPSGRLDLSGAPLVMAVVNCTEDSFYSGSHNKSAEQAVARALKACKDGAEIIDFGAESTRPGASYISEEEEIRRLIPVIEEFRKHSSIPVSVDTRKFEVARLSIEAGADIINDISALEDSPKIGPLCAQKGTGVILMHKKGVPSDMQDKPFYTDVISEVRDYLGAAAKRAEADGIESQRIILDPGIGFGKRTNDNLDLIANFDKIVGLGYPSLMALSRKTFIGDVTGRKVEDRLVGTVVSDFYSLFKGAHIIRVHDVEEAVDSVKMFYALKSREV